MALQSITYIIADDDDLYRALTMQYLNMVPDLQCIGECENAITASALLRKQVPDVLILDIEMPGLSGLQLVKSLTRLPLIIFISSHIQYAADAFEVDAVDYLVKPASPERLFKAIDKVRNLMDLKSSISSHEGFISSHEGFKISDDNSFFIKEKNAFTRIQYQEVLYIESLADFVHIFLMNGTRKIALVNLKNLEPQLPSSLFIRISRTHIVNKQKVSMIENAMIYLDKVQLPVGKAYTEVVMQSVVGNSFIKRHI